MLFVSVVLELSYVEKIVKKIKLVAMKKKINHKFTNLIFLIQDYYIFQ